MLSTMLAAMQLLQSFPPCDVHFRDLGCAAHTIVIVLRRSRSYVPLGGHVSCSSFDDTSCSPSRCLRSRSSFDVRARIRAPVATSSILANGPRHHLRASTLRALLAERTKRVHLLVLVSALVFRRSRPVALHRLTVHGLASSCHVSTALSSDPLSVRGPPLRAAPVNHARARLSTITIALPYGILQNPTRLATCRAR
jgi:hypothetical protein